MAEWLKWESFYYNMSFQLRIDEEGVAVKGVGEISTI